MSQHDYVIDNASGATVRADINSALGAIQSLNSGTSAPSSTAAGMLWLDTTGGAPYALKVRDAGNNHWLTLASVTDPGSDGNIETSATIKGTIDSSATFPTKVTDRDYWYPMSEPGTVDTSNRSYLLSGTLDNTSGAINGCAPTGFSSCIAIKVVLCSGTSGPSAYTPINIAWDIGSSPNSKQEHTANYNVTTSGAFGDNTVREIDIFNSQNNGSDFEDLIAEGDYFGITITAPSMSQVLFGLGVKITWRF